MKVLNCIEKLKETSSTNEKIEIVKDCYKKLGGIWVKTLIYAYDPLKVFYVKKYKKENIFMNAVKLDAAISLLDKLSNREITGNAAVKAVEDIRKMLCREDAEVLDLILQKDLKCGINKKLIQKALGKDLFFEIGYMGAVPYDPKKLDKILNSWVIFSQEKMDGEYSNLLIDLKNNKIEFYSRKNKIQNMPISIKEKLLKELKEISNYCFVPDYLILNGELIIKDYDRYTSNGLLSRIFKYEEYLSVGDTKKAEKAKKVIEEIGNDKYENIISKIKYYIWDYQDTSNEEYYARLVLLRSRYGDLINMVSLFEPVETKVLINWNKFHEKFKNDDPIKEIVYRDLEHIDKDLCPVDFTDNEKAKEEIFKHFQEIIKRGGEGTIVKDGTKPWKDGKPPYQIKLKFEFECEMKIIDFKPGTPGSKFENALGAFICESEDGLVKCDPSGIAEDLRFEIWENRDKYKNKIITVKCNGLSKSKDSQYYSLLHPRFVKFREDKDKADDLNEIQKIAQNILK